jgi:hypothetical protein
MMIWRDVKGNGCGLQYNHWLRAGRPGFDSWQGQDIFLVFLGSYSSGVKRPGRAFVLSTPSAAEVKTVELHLQSPLHGEMFR